MRARPGGDPGAACATRRIATRWGANLAETGAARFSLWAPAAERVAVRASGHDLVMTPDAGGWHRLETDRLAAGDTYAFVLPDGSVVPDPAARAQAGNVHGPSRLVDPAAHRWRVPDWAGRPWEETILYELHIGTFTPEGTFRAAIDRLDHLADLGVTAIELMPVAQFGGNRGWGYDGVLLYAPHVAYGTPEDMKALVDAAHARGLMVFLDVVYNHFGPDGNYLHRYAPAFFHPEIHTPWGPAIAFDEPAVEAYIVDNALYWVEEFFLDGLRFDAIDHIDGVTGAPILEKVATAIRGAVTDRPVHLATEDARNITRLHLRDGEGRPRLYTAEWNDDYHNAAHAAATGETDGYYVDFADDPAGRLATALAEGYVYQGEISHFMGGTPRGEPPTGLPLTAFVAFNQNHDQAGNRAFGERLVALADPGLVKSLAAVLLLSPQIPLLFMGEEWGERRPFLFFTDFHDELADAVREGRRGEFARFSAFADVESRARIPDPNAPATFAASKIAWEAAGRPDDAAEWIALTRTLTAIRAREIAPRLAGLAAGPGEVICPGPHVVAVAWRLADASRLSMAINLSDAPRPMPDLGPGEPLFARPVEPATLPDEEGLAPHGFHARLAPVPVGPVP